MEHFSSVPREQKLGADDSSQTRNSFSDLSPDDVDAAWRAPRALAENLEEYLLEENRHVYGGINKGLFEADLVTQPTSDLPNEKGLSAASGEAFSRESVPNFELTPSIPSAEGFDEESYDQEDAPVIEITSISPQEGIKQLSGVKPVETRSSEGKRGFEVLAYQEADQIFQLFTGHEDFERLGEDGIPESLIHAMHEAHQAHHRNRSNFSEEDYHRLVANIHKYLNRPFHFVSAFQREQHEKVLEELVEIVDEPFICRMALDTIAIRDTSLESRKFGEPEQGESQERYKDSSALLRKLDSDFPSFKNEEDEFIHQIPEKAA